MNKAYLFPLLGVLLGCQTMPPVGMPSPTPVKTAIPAGIYSGEVTRDFRAIVDGLEVMNTTETTPHTETIDDNGLPLMAPGREIPVVGLRIEESNDKEESLVSTIVSVSTSGNKLIIGFDIETRFAGEFNLTGAGQWLYEYIAPDMLAISYSYSALGTLPDGRHVTAHGLWSATLTK